MTQGKTYRRQHSFPDSVPVRCGPLVSLVEPNSGRANAFRLGLDVHDVNDGVREVVKPGTSSGRVARGADELGTLKPRTASFAPISNLFSPYKRTTFERMHLGRPRFQAGGSARRGRARSVVRTSYRTAAKSPSASGASIQARIESLGVQARTGMPRGRRAGQRGDGLEPWPSRKECERFASELVHFVERKASAPQRPQRDRHWTARIQRPFFSSVLAALWVAGLVCLCLLGAFVSELGLPLSFGRRFCFSFLSAISRAAFETSNDFDQGLWPRGKRNLRLS